MTRESRLRTPEVLFALALLAASPSWAADKKPAQGTELRSREEACRDREPCVVYDHASLSFVGPSSVEAADGDVIYLVITRTAPGAFLYPVEGIERPPGGREFGAGYTQLSDKVISIRHEARFDGYRFSITSVDGAPLPPDNSVAGPTLRSTPEPEVIRVTTRQWHQWVAGAFTGSSLSDRQFSLYERTVDGQTLSFVEEDKDAEDEAKLGLAALIHLYHSSWKKVPLAVTFGLGIGDDNRTSYFLGPSWRLGDKGAITVGAVWGSVSRLPTGVSVCGRSESSCASTLAVDANALNQLGSRTEQGWFVALSYSFLDVADLLQKPFKNLGGGAGSAPAGSGEPAEPPAAPNPDTDPDGEG